VVSLFFAPGPHPGSTNRNDVCTPRSTKNTTRFGCAFVISVIALRYASSDVISYESIRWIRSPSRTPPPPPPPPLPPLPPPRPPRLLHVLPQHAGDRVVPPVVVTVEERHLAHPHVEVVVLVLPRLRRRHPRTLHRHVQRHRLPVPDHRDVRLLIDRDLLDRQR